MIEWVRGSAACNHSPLLPISDFVLDVIPCPDKALVVVVIAIGVACMIAYIAARIITTVATTRIRVIAAEANIPLASTTGVGNVATAFEPTTAITTTITTTATNIANTISTGGSLIAEADVKATTLAVSSAHPASPPAMATVSSLHATHTLSA